MVHTSEDLISRLAFGSISFRFFGRKVSESIPFHSTLDDLVHGMSLYNIVTCRYWFVINAMKGLFHSDACDDY